MNLFVTAGALATNRFAYEYFLNNIQYVQAKNKS